MYIERASSKEIPEGAIRLTKEEVTDYMNNLIRNWPNTVEIWALKYGNPVLSSAVVISSTVILNYYRQKLKLRNYGRFTLFLPVVFIPSIFNQIFQNTTTTNSIILQEDCPICITTQSMFIQMGTGVLYPLMSTIGGTYILANKMGTVPLNFNSYGFLKEMATHVIKTSRPFYNRLTVIVIGNVLLSYAVTYYQMDNFEFLKYKMLQQENEDIERVQNRKQNSN